jgi:hypothetical protein
VSYQQDPDYIEVPERIIAFYEKYPEGRITGTDTPYSIKIDEQEFIVFHARAYRTPDDTHPGDGWAWEPVPGTTPFTKNSELMNAQTAAIGRAIVGVGLLASRKVASAEEVRNRQAEEEVKPKKGPAKKKKTIPVKTAEALEPAVRSWLDDHPDMRDRFKAKVVNLGVDAPNRELVDVLAQLPNEKAVDELKAWLEEHEDKK